MKVIGNTVWLLGLALSFGACGGSADKAEEKGVIVHVAQAVAVRPDHKKEFSFISKPFRSSELSFRVGGPVDRFEVYAGHAYRQGDVIAAIDPRDFRIRKERAEGICNQARSEYERIRALYEKNNLSASAYEKAKANYVSAKTASVTSCGLRSKE